MKLSPNAAAQMYPHLVKVTCEAHGDQSRAEVPKNLKGVFASRDNPDYVCAECLSEAKRQFADVQKDLKRKKVEEKVARRAAITQSREDAKSSDAAIGTAIKNCRDSEKTVKTVEQALAGTRSLVKKRKEQMADALVMIQAAKEEYLGLEDEVLALSEKSQGQFEELEKADTSVTTCYNTLQEAVDSAEQLWTSLGKAARKKRDKVNRREGIALLRGRNEKLQPTPLQATGD